MILSLFFSFFLLFPSEIPVKEDLFAEPLVKADLHPIHISVTEINYNEKSKSL